MSETCKGCGAAIEWATTNNGKRIPLDPEPVRVALPIADSTTVEVVVGRQSHFATCPKANALRKPREHYGTDARQCANCEAWVDARQKGAVYIGERSFCNSDCRRQHA